MFLIENNVPDIYVEKSRDFQLLSRLGDLVFHTVKQSTESLKDISSTMFCNPTILRLIATKVGLFNDLSEIEDVAYRKALSAFPYIIRYKGSLRGIEYICNLFEQIANTSIVYDYDSENKSINIAFVKYSSNTDLLETLIEYVRPAGVIVNYIVTSESKSEDIDIILFTDELSSKTLNTEYTIARESDGLNDESGNIGFTQISRVPNDSEEDDSGEDNSADENMISFSIRYLDASELHPATSYNAKKGMTWREWLNSSYNNSSLMVHEDDSYICLPSDGPQRGVLLEVNNERVHPEDNIIADHKYILTRIGGSN